MVSLPSLARAQSDSSQETTYTVAQILAAHSQNWDRLQNTRFMVVRRISGGDTAPAGSRTDLLSSSKAPTLPVPRQASTPQIRPGPSGVPGPAALATPVLPSQPEQSRSPSSPALPQTREILIAGMVDQVAQRSVALMLPGQAAQIYRRRMGDVVWVGEVRALATDGQSGSWVSLESRSAEERTGRTSGNPPSVSEGQLSTTQTSKLGPQEYIRASGFHPRHLSDLAWLEQAWTKKQQVSIRRVGPFQIRVETTGPLGTFQAILSERAGLLPEQAVLLKDGVVTERRSYLLRSVSGIWLAARLVVERPGGYREDWHYELYTANQGLPGRGVTAGFLNLPRSVEVPVWFRGEELTDALPKLESAP